MNRILFFIVIVVATIACNGVHSNKSECEVQLDIDNAYNQVIYVETVPSEGNQPIRLDSFSIKERVERHHFVVNDKEQNLYRLLTRDHRLDIVFINEPGGHFSIHADYMEGKNFSFQHSPNNSSLHNFLGLMRIKMESATANQLRGPELDKILKESQQDYRNYIDTVTSPAAAFYIYNAVDFGNDRQGLRTFIDRLGKRFPQHTAIQQLYTDTHHYLSIFEEELEVGDKIPDLILPDSKGALLPLSYYKGQYLLIDFWASWDPISRREATFKKKAYARFLKKKFTIVSIGLDPEIEMWKQAVEEEEFKWPQLIDEKAWKGPAVMNFKFDSIPFNFLVDPSGKIIGKALYGDSLLLKLEQLIK